MPLRSGPTNFVDARSDRILSTVPEEAAVERKRTKLVYYLFLICYLSVQFGHGSNIGVAVSLPGNSKAMNMALGSWVMVGVCFGLWVTPWVCKQWGVYRVSTVCVVIDFLVILLMLWPGISLRQIYFVRFLVGFFEAPFLPYLQEWLARFGKHTWNVWNTVLHAMVPLGENIGYIVAQELVAVGLDWKWAFAGQAFMLAVTAALLRFYGGSRYLDLSHDMTQTFVEDDSVGDELTNGNSTDMCTATEGPGCDHQVEYPVTERWVVYWATNVSLASQLGYLCGAKYVIRDYGTRLGYSLHFTLFIFSAIALIGPALGGSVAMSGGVVKPDQWSQHKKTLAFLACTSTVSAVVAVMLPYIPTSLFWPALFISFTAAGGVYPAAQGIINIALTATRVIEASVWQVQCNNILFAMPLPYVIGKLMDTVGTATTFHAVTCLQLLASAGFCFSVVAATVTEERSAFHRLISRRTTEATDCGGDGSDRELTRNGAADAIEAMETDERQHLVSE